MIAYVYKSLKKADAYIYLQQKDRFDVIPKPLAGMLGSLEFVMEVNLAERDKLAQADPQQVMEQIREQDFYLQLPPKDDLLL